LNTTIVVLNRTANFFWKGFGAIVHLISAIYEKGVKLCGKKKAAMELRLQRSPIVPLYDIVIEPRMIN
jgi:hypothetical protein